MQKCRYQTGAPNMINIRHFQAAMPRRAQSAFDRSLRTVKSTFALVQPQPRSQCAYIFPRNFNGNGSFRSIHDLHGNSIVFRRKALTPIFSASHEKRVFCRLTCRIFVAYLSQKVTKTCKNRPTDAARKVPQIRII